VDLDSTSADELFAEALAALAELLGDDGRGRPASRDVAVRAGADRLL
jgi:hypothetical protein